MANLELKTASGGSVTLVPEDGVSNVTATVKHESGVLASEGSISTPNSPLVKGAVNATGDAPIYACRAWVNFDGTTTPPTIRASGNVSSVVRNGTGDYTVNFATALPDENYVVSGTSGNLTSTTLTSRTLNRNGAFATTSARLLVQGNNNPVNDEYVGITFFR